MITAKTLLPLLRQHYDGTRFKEFPSHYRHLRSLYFPVSSFSASSFSPSSHLSSLTKFRLYHGHPLRLSSLSYRNIVGFLYFTPPLYRYSSTTIHPNHRSYNVATIIPGRSKRGMDRGKQPRATTETGTGITSGTTSGAGSASGSPSDKASTHPQPHLHHQEQDSTMSSSKRAATDHDGCFTKTSMSAKGSSGEVQYESSHNSSSRTSGVGTAAQDSSSSSSPEETSRNICAAYCLAEHIPLADAQVYLKDVPNMRLLNEYGSDVVHAVIVTTPDINISPSQDHQNQGIDEKDSMKTNTQQTTGHVSDPTAGESVSVSNSVPVSKLAALGHVFLFSSGSVVFWGLPQKPRFQILKVLTDRLSVDSKAAVMSPSSLRTPSFILPFDEFDHEFFFTVNPESTSSSVKSDNIYLTSYENPYPLLACSYALAQSVKLLMYEYALDRMAAMTKTLPTEMARDGDLRLSQKDIKKWIGELLVASYSVTLISDVLDTPEFLWEHSDFQGLYSQMENTVELKRRLNLLEKRMTVIKDVLDVLNSELHTNSSHRIERAILALIAVEVGLEFTRFL